MSDLALLVQLQARVATFLAELPADRLIALTDGRLQLAVRDTAEPGSAPSPNVAPSALTASPPVARRGPVPRSRTSSPDAGPFDPEAVAAQLRASETLDAATDLLAALRLTAVNLKLVAKALNIPPGKTKDETAKRILNLTVGARSKHVGLRQG